MEFILAARQPVKHILSSDDWESFNVLHGGFSLVGYFPDLYHSKGTNRYFQTFLSTSYSMLEVDPYRSYLGGVAAITSRSLAAQIHLNATSGAPIRFYTWNGTSYAFPNKTIGSNPNSKDLLFKWVKSKALQSDPLMGWAGTSGRKSVLLSNWLLKNPTWNSGYSLLAFIDRTTKNNYDEAYSVYQEAALRYKTCKNTEVHHSRHSTYSMLHGVRKMRRSKFLEKDPFGSTKMVDCLTDPWFTRNFADGTPNCDDYSLCPFRSNVTAKYKNAASSKTMKPHETDYYKLSHGKFRRPIFGRPQVDYSIRSNYIMNSRLECVLLFTQGGGGKFCANDGNSETVFEENQFDSVEDISGGEMEDDWLYENINGLGCLDNKTLNFYALDLKTQKTLGEKIGLDFEDKHNKHPIKVVIVSPHEEIIYEMNSNLEYIKSPLTLGQSISRFVNIFHKNPSQLIPLRRSKKILYDIGGSKIDTKGTKSHNSDIISKDSCDTSNEVSCIKEINGETFNRFVMEESSSKNVILLYKSSECAFCTGGSSAAHVFHTVSRLFR